MAQATKQVGSFALVGVVNTIIDFSLFNVGHSLWHLAPFTANLISTTVTMTISFLVNRRYVFGGGRHNAAKQAVLFLLVTSIGLYLLQGGIIYLLTTKVFHSSGAAASNIAKLVGTAASLVWNFVLYKRVVFAE